MKTYVATPTDRERNWLLVDAEGQTLGRLATQIADALRGKRKPTYTPHIDTGDFVVVINAEKISVTGNKRAEKLYYRHSGYPGGLKSRTLNDMLERRPEEVIRLAVRGMLPRNRLARKQLTKLKVYAGPEHPHAAQQPQPLEINTLMAEENRPPEEETTEETPVEDARRRGDPDRRGDPGGADGGGRGRRGCGGSAPAAEEAPAEEAAPAAEALRPRRPPAEEPAPVAEADDGGRRRGRGGARPAREARRSPAPTSRSTSSARARTPCAARASTTRTTRTARAPRAPTTSRPPSRSPSTIDLAAGARYRATGKRKTAVARVILKPGTGAYMINGRTLEQHFPRLTLQRNIRQPLETVGYEERMDVVADDARRRRLGPGRRAAPRHLARAARGGPEPPLRAQAPRLPHA